MPGISVSKICVPFGGGGIDWSSYWTNLILSKFTTTGKYAFISQYGTTSAIPTMALEIGGGRCIEFFAAAAVAVSGAYPVIRNVYLSRFLSSVLQDNAGLTYSGAGWLYNQSSAAAFKGVYARATGTGDYVQWTTPVKTTTIHAWSINAPSNAGMILVTIDGSNTLANLLPTAQQLVTAGTLADTALVANGGTLNPTDRIWNQYNDASTFGAETLADNLTAGAHTIRLTNTGYKQSESSAARLYFSGFGYWSEDITPASANTWVFRDKIISDVDSLWEFAYNFKPSGASNFAFMGHAPSLVVTEAPKYYIDDVEVTPTTGTFNGGTVAKIVASNIQINHAERANIGSVDITYELSAEEGLKISYELTWLYNGEIASGYASMLPFASTAVDRASSVDSTADYTLAANNDSAAFNAASRLAYMWSSAGYHAVALYIPDLASVNNYADCNADNMWVQDRIGGLMEKIYANRVHKPTSPYYAITANDVFSVTSRYLYNYFPAGANTEFARPA